MEAKPLQFSLVQFSGACAYNFMLNVYVNTIYVLFVFWHKIIDFS